MKFEIKKVCDFDFIKIGEVYLAEKPLKASGISSNYKLALKLINEQFLNAEQSAYLVYEEDKLIYYTIKLKKNSKIFCKGLTSIPNKFIIYL